MKTCYNCLVSVNVLFQENLCKECATQLIAYSRKAIKHNEDLRDSMRTNKKRVVL